MKGKREGGREGGKSLRTRERIALCAPVWASQFRHPPAQETVVGHFGHVLPLRGSTGPQPCRKKFARPRLRCGPCLKSPLVVGPRSFHFCAARERT